MRPKKIRSEPVMSTATVLMSVENLINIAMGPPGKNTINYKMLQTVLHILARQLRMLETQVEIRYGDMEPAEKGKKHEKHKKTATTTTTATTSSQADSSPPPKQKRERDIKERDEKEKDYQDLKESKYSKEKDGKDSKDKAEKETKEKVGKDSKDRSEKETKEKVGKDSKDRTEKEMKEKDGKDPKEKVGKTEKEMKERDGKDSKDKSEKETKEKGGKDSKDKAEKETKDKDGKDSKDKAEKDTKEKVGKDSKDKAEKETKEKAGKDSKDKAEKETKEKDGKDSKDKTEKETKEKAGKDSKDKGEKETKERDGKDSKDKGEKETKERDGKDSKDKGEKETKERDGKDSKDKAEKESKEKGGKGRDTKEKEDKEKQIEQEKESSKGKKDKDKQKDRDPIAASKEKEDTDRIQSSAAGKGKKSGPGVAVTEVEREKQKILVVEKGPTTRSESRTKVGSIEVVTLSQFELLESLVSELREKAGPLPMPALPSNKQLRTNLAKGSASLTDTMQAMQVSARVQAAEQAIDRLAGLMETMAASGGLPPELVHKLDDVRAEMESTVQTTAKADKSRATVARKSVAIDPMAKESPATPATPATRAAGVMTRPSVASRPSVSSRASSGMAAGMHVTHPDMDGALRALKDDLMKTINAMTNKATTAAETASSTARAVADKLDIAVKLNSRISNLYEMVNDYAEQLSGFDSGLTTQMQSFQEQMMQMRNDLKGGLTQLEQANNNAETAAVMELTERYDGLALELDNTLTSHQLLTSFQKQLGDDLRSLLEAVEMLREQKADRDEVLDGLRDKADISRLNGLLTEPEFSLARGELERRLELCYDKFQKQEAVWMTALKDLTQVAEQKADLMQLLAARDEAESALNAIQAKLAILAHQLGEPKAAMLTRLLSKDGACGACMEEALMDPAEPSQGRPPQLPALRPPPAPEPCVPQWRAPDLHDVKEHTCQRWVGGSHTLVTSAVTREQASALPLAPAAPVHKYAGYGTDGRLYLMEEELQPCIECNKMSTDVEGQQQAPAPAQPETGAGDNTVTPVVVPPDETK